MTRRYWLMLLAAFLLLGFIASSQSVTLFGKPSALDRAKAGKALWEEKCRTVAGEKIFRKVENVEGLLLIKVRPQAGASEWADPMWPGAAFAREAWAEYYITTFLGYEEGGSTLDNTPTPVTPQYRGSINANRNPGGLPGYRYVDVIDENDGKRYRYKGRWEEPWQYDKSYLKGYIKFFLDKTPAPDPATRYGVTYEDHVIPEDRALGVASSTVKVLDLQTGEVLGKMLRYAWSVPASSANPSPWLAAYRCPDHARGTDAATRKFVDQVLIPIKEK